MCKFRTRPYICGLNKSPMIARRRVDPKDKKNKGAVITRDKKGQLHATKTERYYDTKEDVAIRRASKAKKGDRTYDGAPAPRIGGGSVEKRDGAVQGGSRAHMRQSARRVKKNAASKAAKRSAIRLYR